MNFDPNIDYYNVLGLQKFATREEVKKKYLKLVQMYHPDRNPHADQDKFKQMTAAYTVLSNEKVKQRYDDMKRGYSSGYSNYSSHQQDYSSNYSNYSSNSHSRQGQNFYGYYKDDRGNFYNAKGEYERAQKQKANEDQARQSYEKWYQEMKQRQQWQQARRAQQSKTRYYHNYEDFRADFEKKFREREANYQQNFNSKDYYNYDPSAEENWRTMRGQSYTPEKLRQDFLQLYLRVVVFVFCFIMIQRIIDRIKYNARQQEMMYAYDAGLDSYHSHFVRRTNQNSSIMPPHIGPSAYEQMPEGHRRPGQQYSPLFAKKQE